MYDQQFRLRMSLNPTNSWSQIDGTLWLRFIAKAASGLPKYEFVLLRAFSCALEFFLKN
jgi:hypothetical protein